MNPSTIEVTIDPDGKVTIHVMGVKGAKCTEITAQLEAALGGNAETTLTGEFSEDGGDANAYVSANGGF